MTDSGGDCQTRGESRDYALSAQQLQAFERAARSPRERCHIRLMARWGFRASEASHFCLEWLTGDKGVVTIPKMCRCRVCQERGKPFRAKTVMGNRSLPLFRHVESWEAARIFLERCPTPESAQVTRQAVWTMVKSVARRAGVVDRVFPHALRATAATQLASLGLNEMQLCQAMGWKDLSMARPYVRTAGADLSAALEGKDQRWW